MDILGTSLFLVSACVMLVYGVAIFADALVESNKAATWITLSSLATGILCLMIPQLTLFFLLLGPTSIYLFVYSRSRKNLAKPRKFYFYGCAAASIGLLISTL